METLDDSPGFSATNCCVSAVDLETTKILTFSTISKDETGTLSNFWYRLILANISNRMELLGVQKIFEKIQENDIPIAQLTTDQKTDVKVFMKNNHSEVRKAIFIIKT